MIPPVFRYGGFRLFWFGIAFSSIGVRATAAANLWQIQDITDSTPAVGIVSLLEGIAVIFLGPLAGRLADRVDRRRLILASQMEACVGAEDGRAREGGDGVASSPRAGIPQLPRNHASRPPLRQRAARSGLRARSRLLRSQLPIGRVDPEEGLDRQARPETQALVVSRAHENVRGAAYYA